jgi:hypothetical protein
VGAIDIDESDSKGCSFTIQVLGRPYHLRAESRASCKDWVITLNRVKEARMQQGNVKLVDPAFHHQPPDLLDPSHDIGAPRVVVIANRERTRAVDETQEWDRMMIREDRDDPIEAAAKPPEMKRISTIGTVVLARWSKRKTSLNQLSAKLARWARSVRKYGCTQADSVQLDHHVHPPGHDDKTRPQSKPSPSHSSEGTNAWIGKETSRTVQGGVGLSPSLATNKPQPVHRGISDVSEEGARYLS